MDSCLDTKWISESLKMVAEKKYKEICIDAKNKECFRIFILESISELADPCEYSHLYSCLDNTNWFYERALQIAAFSITNAINLLKQSKIKNSKLLSRLVDQLEFFDKNIKDQFDMQEFEVFQDPNKFASYLISEFENENIDLNVIKYVLDKCTLYLNPVSFNRIHALLLISHSDSRRELKFKSFSFSKQINSDKNNCPLISLYTSK